MNRKNRKKLPSLVAPKVERDPLCQKFRKTADFLQRKNFANALTELNILSGGILSGNRKSQVVRLAAEIQIRQGDYLAAVSILKNEIQKIGPGATKWPSLVNAHLSSLLRANLVNEALDVSQIYQQQAEASYSPLPTVNLTAPGQTATIAPRAIRPSVFATKVGNLFLQHGELMAATEFLKKATSLEPNGASCARSSLAKICLSQAMYPQAEIYATQALEKGMFRKKTLRALPLLMQSRIGQNLSAIDSKWLPKIDQARPSIRERMVLIILEELRKQGDNSWKELATKELKTPKRKNFIYEAELRKVFFADARRQNAPAAERLSYAAKLLNTDNLSPLEWRSAMVQQVSAKLDLEGSEDLARKAVDQAARKFPEVVVWQTRHSMARMALSKGKYALAKEFLQKNVTEISPAERSWSKSKMILARTEYKLGELASSASHYLQIFDNPGSPRERFKIYALLQWSVCVLAMGDTAAIISRKADFEKAIGRVKDYVLLLDTARGLLNAPPEFNALARQVLQRGKDAAQVAMAQAKTASLKSRIHFILARRLSDFGDHREIVGLWENLSSEDQAANWCLAEDFWEFLGLVFVSMWELGRETDAAAFVNDFIQDAATPGVGVAHLSIPLALRYMRGGQKAEAWSLLDRVIQVAPTHTLTAYAYYWYALRGMAAGDSSSIKKYTALIRQSLPPNTALGWQRKLLNRTACLEVEFDQPRLKIALKPNDSDEVVKATIIRTQADLDITKES